MSELQLPPEARKDLINPSDHVENLARFIELFPDLDARRNAALQLADPASNKIPSGTANLLHLDLLTILWRSEPEEVSEVMRVAGGLAERRKNVAGRMTMVVPPKAMSFDKYADVSVVVGKLGNGANIGYGFLPTTDGTHPPKNGEPVKFLTGTQSIVLDYAFGISFDVVGEPERVELGRYQQETVRLTAPLDATQEVYDATKRVDTAHVLIGDYTCNAALDLISKEWSNIEGMRHMVIPGPHAIESD